MYVFADLRFTSSEPLMNADMWFVVHSPRGAITIHHSHAPHEPRSLRSPRFPFRAVTFAEGMETTLVLIKPGGVQRNLIGEITRRVEARGLKVVGLKLMHASREIVEEHYGEHRGKGFFEDVVNYLQSGPVIAMAVEGVNAVKAIRAMMGATNPVDATPGTIRGDFALTIDDNLTHSSSDPEAAARELKLWFPEGTVA